MFPLLRPVFTTSLLRLLFYEMIAQRAELIDHDVEHIAVLEQDGRFAEDADTFGRAGRDHIARFEGDGLRNVMDQVVHLEDHHLRIRRLHHFAVQNALDIEHLRIGDFIGGRDEGADRRKAVEAFAAHPLAIGELQVAGRNVIQAGIAEDILQRVRLCDFARAAADDHGQFGLEVDLLADRVQRDLGVVRCDRVRELGEEQGRFRRLRSALDRVIVIIPPDRDHLARIDDRQILHGVECIGRFRRNALCGLQARGSFTDQGFHILGDFGDIDDHIALEHAQPLFTGCFGFELSEFHMDLSLGKSREV